MWDLGSGGQEVHQYNTRAEEQKCELWSEMGTTTLASFLPCVCEQAGSWEEELFPRALQLHRIDDGWRSLSRDDVIGNLRHPSNKEIHIL